jgi:hypothetical protein
MVNCLGKSCQINFNKINRLINKINTIKIYNIINKMFNLIVISNKLMKAILNNKLICNNLDKIVIYLIKNRIKKSLKRFNKSKMLYNRIITIILYSSLF